MKVVIVGAVAAGMSAATRLRRLDESAQIVVLEAGDHVSFANCGLPYYVGGVIEERSALLLQTPQSLHARFDLDVRVRSRVIDVDPADRTVTVLTADGEQYLEDYDHLILSPGARPIVPDVPGAERALVLRDVADVDRMAAATADARTAVVIGAGFVGLEVAENLRHRGIDVTVVELAPQVLGALDPEMAVRVQDRLVRNGVRVITSAQVTAIGEATADVAGPTGTQTVPADLVVASIGVTPDSTLAAAAGADLGPRGAILVDEDMRTSVPGIYAVGDAAAKRDAFGDGPTLIPLANLANRHGRRVADVIAGMPGRGRPSIGTAVVGVFGLTAAVTGRTERRLRAEGRDYRAIHSHPMDHAGYYPGATQMTLKLLVDPSTDAILGAQGVGEAGVDKRIDIIATAIAGGITASELADLELAYAPAYGSAKDPINMLGYVAENAAAGTTPSVQWHELASAGDEAPVVLDVRTAAEHARGTVVPPWGDAPVNIAVDDLRERHGELPRDRRIVVHCQVGQRGHTATRLLRQLGYDAANLDGGYLTWRDGIRTLEQAAASAV
ncbi:FAD-dependent oxidoreductase [Demequina activiva]|uniref:CoA-disulfide reductase n=1 Tax=Demequina activiva TaxID=1582364 RepID=A0A919Q4B9_9MICO|nr:FAD-dependent oxidoreductase [Demequina activiva]GIG53615.1 CoA-disulfide reductase [Demequina activiva]